MRSAWDRATPYVLGAAGVAAISAAIGLLRPWIDVPNLAVAYLLLVIWVGARHGQLPALATAILAFLVYEFLFVPPYGSLLISGTHDLLNLLLLLGAAALGSRLVARIAAARLRAEAQAQASGTLYQVAVEALRSTDVVAALQLLCVRAGEIEGVLGFGVLSREASGLQALAGTAPAPSEESDLRWAQEHSAPVGALSRGGRLQMVRPAGAGQASAVVPLSGGLALIRYRPGRVDLAGEQELLALVSLAGLLLDRRRALAETARAQSLEVSDRLKAAVLSSLSHELKSPLATLRAGLTTLGLPQAGLKPEQRSMVAGLDAQAQRLDRLVRDLLTMSRLEAGMAGERAPEDVGELIGAVLQALRDRLEAFQLEVQMPALPPVLGDELQLEEVFTNLLQNAIEWTPAGGRIAIGARQAEGELEIWVENQGPEIPPTDLESIFDTFWSGRAGGTGLGLAISRRIVEAHGGSIKAANRRGGTRFTIRLPQAPVQVLPTR
ncbi:MAG TPA: ATP-binding protein [Candidatus Dormibacteraeota bacterium]